MVLAPLLHVVFHERIHVNFFLQELFFSLLRLVFSLTCFLIYGWNDLVFTHIRWDRCLLTFKQVVLLLQRTVFPVLIFVFAEHVQQLFALNFILSNLSRNVFDQSSHLIFQSSYVRVLVIKVLHGIFVLHKTHDFGHAHGHNLFLQIIELRFWHVYCFTLISCVSYCSSKFIG